jgi:hypothetical protein
VSDDWKLRAPRASENDIEAGCKTLLALHGYWVVRLHAGVFQSLDGRRHIHGVTKGTPDYACLHEFHRNFLMEVKRPGGALSWIQQKQIKLLRLQYHLPIVVVESADDLSLFLLEHEKNEGGVVTNRAPQQPHFRSAAPPDKEESL